ncbi:hypothetical protein FACS1894200_03790 [Spirochaetia bacterium]|nr:hypothetical protein FACS1894200_03790 [Spirochaetia bacterium]
MLREVDRAFYGNFRELRPVQETSIEPLLNEKNAVISSGTGSGKTEAVLAPLVSRFWKEAIRDNNLFLLYIAPTKALINDIEKRLILPLSRLHLTIGIRHGDRDDLKNAKNPHILITTPESLDVMLVRKEKKLKTIKAVIIDEVHLFYNTQRGLQLSILLQRLKKETGQSIQIAALSATIGNLQFIKEFLTGEDEEFEYLAFPAARTIDAQIRYIKDEEAFLMVMRKITVNRKILIFVDSRRKCEHIASILQQDNYLKDIIFTHYSSLSTEVRIDIEKRFSTSAVAVCIATSTLELGIDIGDIDLVILWGAPSGHASFLQRIGRGNRRTNKANVLCIVPWDTENVFIESMRFFNLYDRAVKGEMPMHEPYELFGAFGQQALSIIASDNGAFTRITDLYETMKHNKYLTRKSLEAVLSELENQGFLQKHGYKNQYGGEENLHKIKDLKMIYGNFPSGSQNTDLFHGSKRMGDIPSINLLRLHKSSLIRFSGRLWIIKTINRNGIHLEPCGITGEPAEEIRYGGTKMTLSPEEINSVWGSLFLENKPEQLFTSDLKKEIDIITEDVIKICRPNSIPYISNTYFTFAGYLVNNAICLYLSLDDCEINDISIKTYKNIDWSLIPDTIDNFENYFDMLFEESLLQSIYQKLLPLELQKKEYIQSWIKNSEINSILNRLKKSIPVKITAELAEYFYLSAE